MINTNVDGLDATPHDICVVGAGPVGISLALELARLGRSVVVLESGGTQPSSEIQRLADATIADTKHHVPMDIAVQRSLGGTSNLWGGRCVPMGPIDFEPRPFVPESGWPIGAADVAPHLERACNYLGCGQPLFRRPLPGLEVDDTDFSFDQLERWCVQPRTQVAQSRALCDSRAIDVRLRASVVGFDFAADGRVDRVRVSDQAGHRVAIRARCVVLAAGGLENARLLLAAEAEDDARFGGAGGPLGRYYMGHLYGSAAEMVIHAPALDAGMDYFQDTDGFYIRRRFAPSTSLQQSMGLTNATLSPEFPNLYDPAHRNGLLSSTYLALAIPWVGRRLLVESIRRHYVGPGPVLLWPHLLNVVRDAPSTAGFVPGFLYRRYLARNRMPGFFQRNAARRYAVRFHAEHLPNAASRVVLTRERDALGLPRLAIDLRYTEADVLPLLRTHACFGNWLDSTGLGEMTWQVTESERVAHILDQCYDGHHQIGITRMGSSQRDGVVDANCRVFGAENLFVAGTSVFRTSAAANPTLTAVALALRLAALLAHDVSGVST